jgi:hypothetical protein
MNGFTSALQIRHDYGLNISSAATTLAGELISDTTSEGVFIHLSGPKAHGDTTEQAAEKD